MSKANMPRPRNHVGRFYVKGLVIPGSAVQVMLDHLVEVFEPLSCDELVQSALTVEVYPQEQIDELYDRLDYNSEETVEGLNPSEMEGFRYGVDGDFKFLFNGLEFDKADLVEIITRLQGRTGAGTVQELADAAGGMYRRKLRVLNVESERPNLGHGAREGATSKVGRESYQEDYSG